jgi:2-polyprenyl-3-methyl-5-hydroxy-6-metoxy-1,4-benzoquinol methylase
MCGLESIVPQPDDRTLSDVYNQFYFSHYDSEVDSQIVRSMKRATYTRHFRRLRSPASFSGLPRLLDCGAATGFLPELAKEFGWDAFAVEMSEFGSQSCARLLGADRVFRGQVQDASFSANPDGRFEAITMFDFIEHVRDPEDVLRWARLRLTPGGVLLLTTPRVGGLSWRLMGQHWFHYVSEHLWFFSAASLRKLLARNGFECMVVGSAAKAIAVGYALAHYDRDTSHSNILSPVARVLSAAMPQRLKQQTVWCHLGEMVFLAETRVSNSDGGA